MDLCCDPVGGLWELSLHGLNCTQVTDAHVTAESVRVALGTFYFDLLYPSWGPVVPYLLPLPSASSSPQGKLWAEGPRLLLTTDASRGPRDPGLSLAAQPSGFPSLSSLA